MTKPIHFAIDLEPDERLPEAGAATFDNAGVALSSMARLRASLARATGAPANFGWYVRMDRHIAALFGSADAMTARYRRELELALEVGDEIGLHVHSAEQDNHGRWRVNYADENLIADTVAEAAENFHRFFGRPCLSARMGDMWTSEACMRQFARLGIRYDASIETGLRPQNLTALYPGTTSKGRRPSMVACPLKPYQPFAGEAGVGDMWVLPLSSHPRRDFHRPGMWVNTAYTCLSTGFRRCRARDVVRPQSYASPDKLQAALAAALSDENQPGLCVAVRNFGAADRLEAFFDLLCDYAGENSIQFCTPADYVRLVNASS